MMGTKTIQDVKKEVKKEFEEKIKKGEQSSLLDDFLFGPTFIVEKKSPK